MKKSKKEKLFTVIVEIMINVQNVKFKILNK